MKNWFHFVAQFYESVRYDGFVAQERFVHGMIHEDGDKTNLERKGVNDSRPSFDLKHTSYRPQWWSCGRTTSILSPEKGR